MTERNLTCIICPVGCSLNVKLEDKKVIEVTGNTCPRGKEYAKNECTNPQRTITTTVKAEDGTVVPVKTLGTIPKEKMAACMQIINKIKVHLPVFVGDVIIDDIYGTKLVATKNTEENS